MLLYNTIGQTNKKERQNRFLEQNLLFPVSIDSAVMVLFSLSYYVRKIRFGQKWNPEKYAEKF